MLFKKGISFNKSKVEVRTIVYMILLFSMFAPLGVVIGMILTGKSDLVEGIMIALSSGTFLYVACGEVIVEEFSISTHKFIKFVFLVLGILLIFGLTVYEATGEEHIH